MALVSLREHEIKTLLDLIHAEIRITEGRLSALTDRFDDIDSGSVFDDLEAIQSWAVHRFKLELIQQQLEKEAARCKG